MTAKEIGNAINENKIVTYDGMKCQVCGYQVLKRNGEKQYSAGLLDLKNNRTVYWVDAKKLLGLGG